MKKLCSILFFLIHNASLHCLTPQFGLISHSHLKDVAYFQIKDVFYNLISGQDLYVQFNTGYAFTDTLCSDVIIPYFILRERDGARSFGLGDISLRTNYKLYDSQKPDDELRLIFTNVITFPTGDPTILPATGLGAYGVRFNGALTYQNNWYEFYAALGYDFFTTFKGKKAGSVFQSSFLGGIKATEHLSLRLEFATDAVDRTEVNGILDPTTGGFVGFLGPTIFYRRDFFEVAFCYQSAVIEKKLDFKNRMLIKLEFFF